MSRTKRLKAKLAWKTKCFRFPKSKASQTSEHYAAAEIEEAGFEPPNHQRARANPKSRKIPTAYDDLRISAFQ